MLILKQVTQPYEVLKCKISNQMIIYGDFYYEDNEDGTIVKYEVYKKIRDKARRDKFDYSQLEKAQNEREYRQMIRKAQSEFLIEDMLTRPVAKNGEIKENGLE